jgi:hypothetical protein
MVIESFGRPDGKKTVQVKVVSRFGFSHSGKDVYPGDVFETDEYTSRMLVNQNRVEILSTPALPVATPAATEPGAGEDAGTGDPVEQEPKPRGRRSHE